jgi:hypothetical protein
MLLTIKYNLFKDAHSIKNINTCVYDSTDGYVSDFSLNGNVSGWDIYFNICLYGVWDGVLFGTALDNVCYIGRTSLIDPLQAEYYYSFKLTMKLTVPEEVPHTPTTCRLMWQTVSDMSWTINKSIDIRLVPSNKWHTYIINVGESQFWIGDIVNLRFYPFIDGRTSTQFAIKYIGVNSSHYYKCSNTQCSHHFRYSHPCPFIGKRSSIIAGISKDKYVTIND